MPEGIIATDHGDGFVTLDFVDGTLRGPALAELMEIGGPATIETITRKGPRRQYRVPLANATEAGLVDEENTVEGVHSAGADTGAAAALVAADPNVNPGADNANWHTPVDEYTSANAYVGQVPNEQVLDRVQVHTGDAGSYDGSAKATTHRDLIEHVKANSSQPSEDPATLEPTPGDPAPTPTPAPATAPTQTWPDGEPTEDWKRAELDAYALSVKGIDTSQEPNKAAVVTAIQNAPTPGA